MVKDRVKDTLLFDAATPITEEVYDNAFERARTIPELFEIAEGLYD